jgi:type IV pilus assembly protein PilE
MSHLPSCSTTKARRPARQAGFTLIELMIAVALIGILAAIALPAYNDSVRKSRRSDAVATLTAMQQAQERWRANNASYTTTLSNLGLASSTTPGGHYGVAIDAADASGYILSATAVSGSSQAADSNCTRMRLQLVGGNVFYGGCAGCDVPTAPATVSDPNRCWSK